MSIQQDESKNPPHSDEEDEFFLQPMFQKSPQLHPSPNTPHHSQFQVRMLQNWPHLSTRKDLRCNHLSFTHHTTSNSQGRQCSDIFKAEDSVGKHYVGSIGQIVFLRFDNSKHNLVEDKDRRMRAMTAFYVPFQQIYTQHNVPFTRKLCLHFPDFTPNALLPTCRGNRGQNYDPLFSSSSQSTNLFAVFRKDPFQYELLVQNDVNNCSSTGWFYFSVQFMEEGCYRFKITNITTDITQLFQRGFKIVSRVLPRGENPGSRKDEWQLNPGDVKFGRSCVDGQPSGNGQKYYQLAFTYRCRNKNQMVSFALSTPYSSLQAEKFYNRLIFKKARGMLKVERVQFGRTMAGSPLHAYLISRRKFRGQSMQIPPHFTTLHRSNDKRCSLNLSPSSERNPDAFNRSVVIIGRMKGADNSSSFILQGIIEYLVESSEFDKVKRSLNFYFIPFFNIDGMHFGHNSGNLAGSDLCNWQHPHKLHEAETFHLKEYLSEINRKYPIAMISAFTSSFQHSNSSAESAVAEDNEDCKIFPYILSRKGLLDYESSHFSKYKQDSSMCCLLGKEYPESKVYKFQIGQFFLQQKDETKQLRQYEGEDYRQFGKSFISNYLEYMKLFDRNILLRDKWIKQIHQLQAKLPRKLNNFVESQQPHHKFDPSFTAIKQTSLINISEIKSTKSLLEANPTKVTYSKHNRQTLRNSHWSPSFNSILEKKRESASEYWENEAANCKTEKPTSLFRIAERKGSVFRHLVVSPPFEVEGKGSGQHFKQKADKFDIQKELLKKQLFTKLRRVKIQAPPPHRNTPTPAAPS